MGEPSTSAPPKRAAPFFNDEGRNFTFERLDNLTHACLFGNLKASKEWELFSAAGEPDPGYLEFQTRIVPRLKKFIFGYKGFPSLRWMLGQIVSGLSRLFGATHLATTSLYDGTDLPYREHVAVHDVMKVGPTGKGMGKNSRNVVEAGDFIVVTRLDKKMVYKVACQVLKMFSSLLDGQQWLLVQPVRAFIHALGEHG
jgi:hypothetical protein